MPYFTHKTKEMLKISLKAGLFAILASILFFSCKKNEPQPADVLVDIKTYVKNDEVVKNDIKYETVAGHQYSLTKLVYYLSHINIVKEDGTVVQLKKAHLRNIDESLTERIVGMDVPPGHYTAMTFTFGINKSDNVVDFLENTVSNQNMYWPDVLGPGTYHYMKLEGQYKAGGSGVQKGFAFHLGPTSGADYSIDVNQPIDLNIDDVNQHLTIKMDIDKWFHSPNDWDFQDWSGGIMDKTAAQVLANENGQNVFSVSVD